MIDLTCERGRDQGLAVVEWQFIDASKVQYCSCKLGVRLVQ